MRSYIVERRFKPGEIAQESGVYRVLHHRHRPEHQAIILAGLVFPLCRRCGDQVRFELLVPAQSWSLDGDHRTPSLLIVDDEAQFAEELKQALENDGYVVSTASSYAAAAGLLARMRYDAIITELDLEAEHAGLELARTAQSLRSPPLVFVSTAEATERKLRSILGTRIHYLLTKPVDLGELRSTLTRLMLRRAVTAALVNGVEQHP